MNMFFFGKGRDHLLREILPIPPAGRAGGCVVLCTSQFFSRRFPTTSCTTYSFLLGRLHRTAATVRRKERGGLYAGRACSVDEGKRLGQSRRYANKRSAAKAVQEVRERVFASCCPFTFLSCCWPVVWHASPLLRARMFIVRTVVSHVTGRRVYVPQLARIWPDSHASQEPDSTEFLSFSFPFYFEYVLR